MQTSIAPGAQPSPLRLAKVNGVQDALAYAFEVAVGASQVIEHAGQDGAWMFLFSQPLPLRISLHLNLILFPLIRLVP